MDINYETAYKEALERAQNVSGEWSSPEAVAKYVFPEIKNTDTDNHIDHKHINRIHTNQHTIDKIFERQSFAVVINETTGNSFRARSVKCNKGNKLNYPSVIIEAENINDAVPVIGEKITITDDTVITKKEVIGNNKQLKILHCKPDNTIVYEVSIYNAWIKEISDEDNIVILNCDYIA